MSSLNKCKNCGSSDLDVDPARGDTVCTNCGTVLEDSVIVSEIQFEENAHGGATALGHFVSSDSKGGCQGFGGALRGGLNRESREITLDNSKKKISALCNQLRLNQHCLETSFNLYKMALSRHLTKGRRQVLVCAACVYMTCRLEGTSHLLIDFSELLQICMFELGRTYIKLSTELHINIPSMDPCLYVLRYSNRLDFGPKTHDVTMTALRILQRMKKDMLHSGRRPNGLIGAALLMASRWHDFNRSVTNIINVVSTTESTLKKRLLEFGDTPSSGLTLEEFMNVDLEEEQDPPAYKIIRTKDSDRVQRMIEDEDEQLHFVQLRKIIEKKLDQSHSRKRKSHALESEEDEVMGGGTGTSFSKSHNSVLDHINISPGCEELKEVDAYMKKNELPRVIEECLSNKTDEDECAPSETVQGIGPTQAMLGMGSDRIYERHEVVLHAHGDDLADVDDDEIDSYILSETEVKNKSKLWNTLFNEYLQTQADKKAREEAEGKKERKKRKPKNKNSGPLAKTAQEAIERMLKEKKISSKINYDVLKSLDVSGAIGSSSSASVGDSGSSNASKETQESDVKIDESEQVDEKCEEMRDVVKRESSNVRSKRGGVTLKTQPTKVKEEKVDLKVEQKIEVFEEEEEDDYEREEEEEEEETLSSMLRRNVDEEEYDDY